MDGDRVLVLESRRVFRAFDAARALPEADSPPRPSPPPPAPPAPRTRLTLVDVAGAPRVVATLTSDTEYVDARQSDGTVHVVVRSTPRIDFPDPTPRPQKRTGRDEPSTTGRPGQTDPADQDAIESARRAVMRAPLNAWLPTFTVDRDARRAPSTGRRATGSAVPPPTAGAVRC
ncbi:hypothetical protein BJF79_25125 [Actinomadura sp. CNU-125]|nr:hypothetical protein BJF79_25125 [Actinomadura sp. CNU-125]